MRMFNRSIVFVLRVSTEKETQTITFAEPLHIEFEVTKDTTDSNNSGTVSVYNIAKSHRNLIQSNAIGYSSGFIYAGYSGSEMLIFSGDISEMKDTPEDADIKTTFTLSSGFNAKQKGSISLSFPPKTKYSEVIKTVSGFVQGVNFSKIEVPEDIVYPRGVSVSKNPLQFIMDEVKSKGHFILTFDGQAQVSEKKTSSGKIFVCSASTGMIGFPEQITEQFDVQNAIQEIPFDQNGEVSKEFTIPTKAKIGYLVKMLLNGEILPNDEIDVTSTRLLIENMRLKVESVKHIGSNYGNDFYTIIEAFLDQNPYTPFPLPEEVNDSQE